MVKVYKAFENNLRKPMVNILVLLSVIKIQFFLFLNQINNNTYTNDHVI